MKTRYFKIGSVNADSRGNLVGTIRTMSFALPLKLVAVEDKRNDDSPDFTITTASRADGGTCDIGSAWRGRTEDDRAYVSLKFSDPDVPPALRELVGFINDKDRHTYDVCRSEKQGGAQPSRQAAPAPDDEIPY